MGPICKTITYLEPRNKQFEVDENGDFQPFFM